MQQNNMNIFCRITVEWNVLVLVFRLETGHLTEDVNTVIIYKYFTTLLQAQKIINDHMDHRRDERRIDPGRFGIKPTLGDRCVRHLYTTNKTQSIHLSTTTEIPCEQRMFPLLFSSCS